MIYAIFASAAYMVFVALIMNTGNFRSFLLFKFIPFALGLILLIHGLMEIGFVIAP